MRTWEPDKTRRWPDQHISLESSSTRLTSSESSSTRLEVKGAPLTHSRTRRPKKKCNLGVETLINSTEHKEKYRKLTITTSDSAGQSSSRSSSTRPGFEPCTFLGGFLPNHKEWICEPTYYWILKNKETMANWIHIKTSSDLKVINFLNQRIPTWLIWNLWALKLDQWSFLSTCARSEAFLHHSELSKTHHFLPKLSRYKETSTFLTLADLILDSPNGS